MKSISSKWVIIIGLFPVIFACSSTKKIIKTFEFGEYEKVIAHYKNILKDKPNDNIANYYVAESYRQSNRIKESELYYSKIHATGSRQDSVNYYYSQALKANGKYEEAKTVLQNLVNSSNIEKLRNRAQSDLNSLINFETMKDKDSYYKVKNLEKINTPFSEYSPAYLNSELYFSSSRANKKIYIATGTPFTNLFKVESKGANVDVNTIQPLPEVINTPNVNLGCIAFDPTGKIMIFAKGNSGNRKGDNDVDLYISRFRKSDWSKPQKININLPDSWESTPAFSPDGKTLYFSSNRRGGFGGLDLYSAQFDSRGRFSHVLNLGPDINTYGNELFPYVSETEKLYFSSDAHSGYGMLDIFTVNRVNGVTEIQNLGAPMNSSGDDFALFLFQADRGFFSSNREGGKGDDDIYTFINEDPDLKVVNYYLKGITYFQRKDGTREILSDVTVSLIDQKGSVLENTTSDNQGNFLLRVYENENYNLVGEADGFLVKRGPFTTVGKSVPVQTLTELVTKVTFDTLLVLDRLEKNLIIQLKNIYFGYDSANINSTSALELDRLIDILNDNPEIKIEMGSHTDSIGTVEYNIDLSQRRAESTVQYLTKHGIDPNRLVAKGYGKSIPIAPNSKPDGSDNPEGRARNRRTEFKILEINSAPKKKADEGPKNDDDKFFSDTIDN